VARLLMTPADMVCARIHDRFKLFSFLSSAPKQSNAQYSGSHARLGLSTVLAQTGTYTITHCRTQTST